MKESPYLKMMNYLLTILNTIQCESISECLSINIVKYRQYHSSLSNLFIYIFLITTLSNLLLHFVTI